MAKKTKRMKDVSKPSAKQKILIVDDEKDIRDSVKLLVEGMGYETGTAHNGKAALEALKQGKYDLVLLDVLMPEMSGRETLEEIRADPKLKRQKVAFMTVVHLSECGKGIMDRLRPVEYFQKPIDVADFRRRLKRLLG
jgi:CheY-like chemotaxis protein